MRNKVIVGFALLTVFLQIIWPLTQDAQRVFVTQISVLSFVLASFSHAYFRIGRFKSLLVVALTVCVAWIVEFIGTQTGVLFGDYEYSEILQPQIASVPLTVLGAWFMMLWPACVAAAEVANKLPRIAQATFAGFLMMSWDFFLDTQMVTEGYWSWNQPNQTLIGMPGIPWTNYVSWFVVGSVLALVVLSIVKNEAINREPAGPAILLIWTWLGGFIAHSFFWNNLGTAAWGTSALGVCCLLFIRELRRSPETIHS